MTVIDIIGQQSHDDDFEDEIQGWHVEQAEEEEPGGAEVEGEQAVPLHQWQRLAVQLLTYLGGHVTGTAVFLAQQRHEALELRGDFLLFACIVDIRFLEGALYPIRVCGHLLVDLFLSLTVVEFAALLALQKEEVYLIIVVG